MNSLNLASFRNKYKFIIYLYKINFIFAIILIYIITKLKKEYLQIDIKSLFNSINEYILLCKNGTLLNWQL